VEVKSIQVEEGFLDGLDLRLTPGLNVLIGARGSGKTSVIELLRFCLGRTSYAEPLGKLARQHAISVLGRGRVTVTVETPRGELEISRSVDDPEPRGIDALAEQLPIILSQNEIERVGLDSAGRLKLIDDFRTPADEGLSEDALVSDIASTMAEIQGLRSETDDIEQQLEAIGDLTDALQAAETEAADVASAVLAASVEQSRLDQVGKELARLSVAEAVLERSAKAIDSWKQAVSRLGLPSLENWPDAAGEPDAMEMARSGMRRMFEHLHNLLEAAGDVQQLVESVRSGKRAQQAALEEEARGLRRRVNEVDQGAGAVSQRLAELRERIGQASALEQLRETKWRDVEGLREMRGGLLDDLDRLRESRFLDRLRTVEELRALVGPAVGISIERYGMHGGYANAIATALRGSGLHYSNLAPLLSDSLSPRELIEAAETNDAEFVARVADMSLDRARRVLDYIALNGGGEVLTAPLDDLVILSLLDGGEYKPTEVLSTGQRCTVVLPMLLAHRDQVLIVDQPEDNLDNAFIVDTVVDGVGSRAMSQTIFATHNPNIPVLGDAKNVVLMHSDGIRGFVQVQGPLHASSVVDAISNVMEGGREAFERRARFYLRAE
jgi:energy-coupling factor transporter ATP-binding protein EcfA2